MNKQCDILSRSNLLGLYDLYIYIENVAVLYRWWTLTRTDILISNSIQFSGNNSSHLLSDVFFISILSFSKNMFYTYLFIYFTYSNLFDMLT